MYLNNAKVLNCYQVIFCNAMYTHLHVCACVCVGITCGYSYKTVGVQGAKGDQVLI